MAISGCRECRKTFTSISAFDMHRTGSYGNPIYDDKRQVIGYAKHERRCCTEQEMLDKEMLKNKNGYWTTGEFDASVFKNKESEVES